MDPKSLVPSHVPKLIASNCESPSNLLSYILLVKRKDNIHTRTILFACTLSFEGDFELKKAMIGSNSSSRFC